MLVQSIYVDEGQVKERLGALESQSTKVIVRAVNRSYTSGKNAIAEEARKGYYLSQHDVNGKNILKITKATYSNPVATLKYTDRHRNLYLWNGKKAVSPGKIINWSHGKPNVPIYKAAVKRGHGKVELRGENKPFIQKVRSGEDGEFVGLFRRRTAKRDSQLVGVGGPATPQILKQDKIMDKFQRTAGPVLQKRLDHEIDAVLKGVVK